MNRPSSAVTAVVVVDVQNDFADPAGSLSVTGGVGVVQACNVEIGRAEHVVYTQDWHPPTTPHFATGGGTWPVHCVRDTWGAAFHPALQVRGQVVRKGVGGEDGYSGFSVRDPQTQEVSPTGLDGVLRRLGVSDLVVVGLATDYCVLATALDARALGWPVHVVRSAVAAVDLEPGDGERALAQLVAAGVVLR